MEKISSSPIYSNDGPQPSPEPERIPTPDPPKLVSYNDTVYTLSSLIKNKYDIFPQFPESFAVVNNHIFRVVFLGETHGDDTHAVANARVVDYLWKVSNGRMLLFTEDGAKSREPKGQARFVLPEIEVQRWDQLYCAEVKEVFQSLSQLSINSVNEMNLTFKEIDRIQGFLSKTINLHTPIESLKSGFSIVSLIREIPPNHLLMLSDKCLNITVNFNNKIQEYISLVKTFTHERDKFLHTLIKETLLKHHNFKICVISGSDHVHPALEFLKQQNISTLALIPKQEPELVEKI